MPCADENRRIAPQAHDPLPTPVSGLGPRPAWRQRKQLAPPAAPAPPADPQFFTQASPSVHLPLFASPGLGEVAQPLPPIQPCTTHAERLLALSQELDEWLRVGPTHRAPTAFHIPRRCRQLAGRPLTRELKATVLTLNAPASDVDARLQQARMLALPQILCRQPLKQSAHPSAPGLVDPSGGEGVDPDMSLAVVIKDRLTRAYRGEWRGLLQELLADEAAAAQVPLPTPPRRLAHHKDEVLPPSRLVATAAKGIQGDLRSVKDLLVGGPPVPPSPAVDQQVHDLFRTAEFADQEKARLTGLLQRAAQAGRTTPVRTTARKVTRRIAALKPNAAPGPSGWRNAYLAIIAARADGPL